MATFESPADLAAALYCDGRRPIDDARLRKLLRHITSPEQFYGVIEALPEHVRESTVEQMQTLVTREPALRANAPFILPIR